MFYSPALTNAPYQAQPRCSIPFHSGKGCPLATAQSDGSMAHPPEGR